MSIWVWLCGLWLACWGYSTLWKKVVSGKLRVSFTTSEDTLVAGDVWMLTTVIENHSWMPIPLVELWKQLPEGLVADHGERWRSELVYSSFLLPRQRVSLQQAICCKERGMYRLSKAEIKLGDGLGLSTLYEEVDSTLTLLVRPRPLEDPALHIRCEDLLGETAVLRWYQEDASRLQGVRAYQSGDPYRHLHWAATARSNQLMVKQFETTSETQLYVIPNAQFFDTYWSGGVKRVFEYQLRLAATLLHLAHHQHLLFGLCTNAGWQGSGALVRYADRGSSHLDLLLDLLGGLTQQAVCPYAELLLAFRGQVVQPSVVVLLTPYWNEPLQEVVRGLLEDGHRVILATTMNDPSLWERLDRRLSLYLFEMEEEAA